MSEHSVPAFEFEDHGLSLAIDVNPQAAKPIRVRAATDDIGGAFELSVTGAQRFSVMLSAAITRAINNR